MGNKTGFPRPMFLFTKLDCMLVNVFASLYLNYFQTTERHSYDGKSIYKPIFNLFLEAIYPVAVIKDMFLHFYKNHS